MDTIFDGIQVAEISFPRNFPYGSQKKQWGMEVLGNYVAAIHGGKHRQAAQDNGNWEGRLTGIKIIVSADDKEITYAIVEPKHNPEGKILITKSERILKGGSISDVIEQEVRQMRDKLESPLAAALKKAGADKAPLPEKAEVVILEVNLHPESRRPAFKPIYPESDPAVGNAPSMRMFHGVPRKGALKAGQKWSARVKNLHPAGKTSKGIPIVHVNVVLLELLR